MTTVFIHLFTKGDLISEASIAAAYAELFLTAAALLLGPLNVPRGKANPVSFDLRRDFGIWAGIAALVHTLVGLNVHLAAGCGCISSEACSRQTQSDL